ncbi:SMP-30/gluconolactonase/LRE family protein [Marisediminicola sp. LYQ134]|uniref:SMP-30/gluconolactonase/LRE family protein n=1 Tax=unclassified Marisediminicola TaxID=2618316 RepID=UPI0039831078
MTNPVSVPRLFRDSAAILGESIVWDAAANAVLWCDITAGTLHRSPIDGPVDGSADEVVRVPPPLASFHPAAGGGLVASLGDRVVLLDDAGVVVREVARIEHAHGGMRLNEGKADPSGRWITGSMDFAGTPDGAFYSVGVGGDVRVLRGGFGTANGIDFSDDGSRIFFTDTAVSTIYVGDYSVAGEIGDVEPFHQGEPHDGLTLDVEGYVWSGLYGEGRVVRYTPDGVEDLVVALPVPNITSVAFGGADLSTLFVASARENLTEEQLREHPLSGGVFAIDTGTHGRHPHSFG